MTVTFEIPADAEAGEPAEARGLRRDAVRLLVASPAGLRHTDFADLPGALAPGDVVVVNTSATLPAAVDGERTGGRPVAVHFSTALADDSWAVEIRPRERATGPVPDATAGELITLPGGGTVTLLAPYPHPDRARTRLWRGRVAVETAIPEYLARYGRPIRYGYVPQAWPLAAYQTVFAREPGSAEMPSAGRPFTAELVTALVTRGISVAPITLHAGVSSPEAGEPPMPERYSVPEPTARLVNATRAVGGRVVAVGTTVTRALETVADRSGVVRAGAGWTSLALGPARLARVVTGLVTGWHAPGASHLQLLEAVAGPDLVAAAYREAVRSGYLWHEFGDSCLLLP